MHAPGRLMKASVYRDYGSADVLHREDAEMPSPGDDEVLIRIRAAAVNPSDYTRTWRSR
jgi:NADPH:quinone reductase-like Zn-dependent oxidoreductase